MDHCVTDYIDIKSEVEQNGIMFPQLYNAYVDDLMEKLSSEKLSCMIGDISYGVVLCADGIILSSGSKRIMQRMKDMCYDYDMINGITFNSKKSKWFVSDTVKYFSDCEFKLDGAVIECESICIL